MMVSNLPALTLGDMSVLTDELLMDGLGIYFNGFNCTGFDLNALFWICIWT